MLAASITTLMCSGVNASDIEIYTAPATGGSTTTLMMMLDISGSMRVTHPTPSVALAACDFPHTLMLIFMIGVNLQGLSL